MIALIAFFIFLGFSFSLLRGCEHDIRRESTINMLIEQDLCPKVLDFMLKEREKVNENTSNR